jgi:transcriptional regulator with XRE-family HTH domain
MIEGEIRMDYKSIGYRIKIAREQKHLTQEQLSEIIDISPMHMSVIERGVKGISLATLVKIANALEVSTDELLQDVLLLDPPKLNTILSMMIDMLPTAERNRLFHLIKAYVEGFQHFQ